MDYKYIEQLLERYWKCETSTEEESILRSFFYQEEIPAHLLPYKDLFIYEQRAGEVKLSDDFDARILDKIDEEEPIIVKARRITMTHRMMPLFKAAAVVAMVLTLGNAAQKSLNTEKPANGYNYTGYKDTYSDPTAAYDKVEDALQLISEGIQQADENVAKDSIQQQSLPTTKDSCINE